MKHKYNCKMAILHNLSDVFFPDRFFMKTLTNVRLE